MASSSRSYQPTPLNNTDQNFKQDEKVLSKPKTVQEEEEEKDWLILGLGLGVSSIKSPTSHNPILVSSTQTCYQMGLGFQEKGLGLEPRKGKEKKLDWLNGYNNNDHDHYHHDDDSSMLWPPYSSSSSSCQIMNPRGEDLIPSDSRHYCARRSNLNYQNQSGFWFTLRSFTNLGGEALPQISKEYIRVKDENMTVLMVKKYLVTKLGLSNESEIDISCMGESLSHIQTLKQVRDTVWLPRLVESVNSTTLSLGVSHDMTMNHLMSLIYQKHCMLN